MAGNPSAQAHVISNTHTASCGTYGNTANFTTDNSSSDSASASVVVLCATTSISQTADAGSVSAGSGIGFTVVLSNSGAGIATGLSVTDNLPAGNGVNWTIDAANTDPGWAVSGTPPNQNLDYSPTTLGGNTSIRAHVVGDTTSASCGSYYNMAGFTTGNDGSGSASASEIVVCPTPT